MDLKEITTSGFKNLGKTTINFCNNHITSIIAPNNYGKSNFLESLDFSYDFIQANPKQKKTMMEYFPAIPINKYIDQSNFLFSVEFETAIGSVINLVHYQFEFEWLKNETKKGSKIVSEILKVKEAKANSKFTTLIKRDKHQTLYQSSIKARCNTKINISHNNLLVNNMDHVFLLVTLQYQLI